MRLTCPNCAAEYDISDGMIPAAGRHVQCTACHTRWFVRGVPGTGLTEDQILRRLETWSPGPRPVAVPSPGTLAEPAPSPARIAPEPARRAADPAVVVPLPPPRSAPAKPADRPAVARPGPLAEPAAPPPLVAARPATRLDLGEPSAVPVAAEAPAPSRSRSGRGLLVALALCLIALGAYLYRDTLAARVPAARPALQAYGERVDHLRERLEEQLGRFRPSESPEARG